MNSHHVIIRPYDERDEEDVVALWNAETPRPAPWNEPRRTIQKKLRIQRELFLVAELGGNVVGTTMAGYDGHRAWIYSVLVTPAHRRKGIAVALLEEAERQLIALGCPKVNLQVHANNPAAVQLYEKMGFHIEDRVSMGKRLSRDA